MDPSLVSRSSRVFPFPLCRPRFLLLRSDPVFPSSISPLLEFAWNDHGSLWTAYKNGLVAQLDVRLHSRPIDDIPRSTVCWDPAGNLAFALDQWTEGEMPFDDL